jgi:hypothetical protein
MAHSHWASGVTVLLAFVCYLRIGELVSLKVGDVAMAGFFKAAQNGPSLTQNQDGPKPVGRGS